jgi:hypothetical protein
MTVPSEEGGSHPWFRPRLTETEAIAAFETWITKAKNNLLANCEYEKSGGRKKRKKTKILEIVYEKGVARVEIEYRMSCSTLKYGPPGAAAEDGTKPGRMEIEKDSLQPGVEGKTYQEIRKREKFIYIWKNGRWVVEKKEGG